MDKRLVSSWYGDQSLPEKYVQPPEKRPGKLHAPPCKAIPVVDLGFYDRASTAQEIIKACEEYGFFQAINHGVPEGLMKDSIKVFEEFHAMPAEEKVEECSKDPSKNFRLYTSSDRYANEEVHYWKDTIRHPCHPLDRDIQFWPEKPSRYREVVGAYTSELRKLSLEILGLISEGLGLSPSYFSGALTADPILMVHHYPPCPDPSLTLGLAKHRDPSLLTILLQGNVKGLEVLKDCVWLGVDPVPHAFVVNIGYILQIISNGKLIGAEHRAVTNSEHSRTTAAYFAYPSEESIVEPAKELISMANPPLYKSLKYKEFYECFMGNNGVESVEKFIRIDA